MAQDEHPTVQHPAGGFVPVLRRELRRAASSRFYLMYLLVLPLASFAIFAATFYQEVPRDLPIAICDGDNSSLSREAIRLLDASPSLASVAMVHDIAEGADLIREGKVYAIVWLPASLEHDVARGESPAVTLYYNNQWLLTSGIISRGLRDSLKALSTRLDVQTRMAGGENPAQAVERYEPIRVEQYPLFNPYMDYRPFLLPPIFASMMQIFIVLIAVRAVGTELRHGTAGEWLAASGGRTGRALAGKLFPYVINFVLLTWFMLFLLVRYLGVPALGNVWMLLGASVVFVLACLSMGCTLITLTSNLRLANSLAGFYVGPAFAFSGVTFPIVGMPLAARIWSRALPLHHYMNIFTDQTLRGAPLANSYVSLGLLGLFIAIPLVFVFPRLDRILREPKYWGRQ